MNSGRVSSPTRLSRVVARSGRRSSRCCVEGGDVEEPTPLRPGAGVWCWTRPGLLRGGGGRVSLPPSVLCPRHVGGSRCLFEAPRVGGAPGPGSHAATHGAARAFPSSRPRDAGLHPGRQPRGPSAGSSARGKDQVIFVKDLDATPSSAVGAWTVAEDERRLALPSPLCWRVRFRREAVEGPRRPARLGPRAAASGRSRSGPRRRMDRGLSTAPRVGARRGAVSAPSVARAQPPRAPAPPVGASRPC